MKIYNTLTKKKEEFKTVNKDVVNMYVCGPTVYNYIHIGNARPFLFFDVVRKYFEYKGYKVNYAQNITDVEDKLINQSIKEGKSVSEIANKYIKAFYEDLAALNIAKVNYQPRATQYISKMVALIKKLEDKGIAYEVGGDVFYGIEQFSDYGKLSKKNFDKLKSGARVKKNTAKKHPADFTLWKKNKPDEPKWQSPWGNGRPGWHTECVVMSRSILGETFDIHGGGVDLIFPHHENEIAQAEADTGKPLANYWMHNGYLNVEGEKMSKSLDNFFLVRDVLKHYRPEAIRYFFLSKHYRSPIDFNEKIIKESQKAVDNLYSGFRDIEYLHHINEKPNFSNKQKALKTKFMQAMDDDFNTAKALAIIFEINKEIKNRNNQRRERINYAHLMNELGQVLGFFSDIASKLSAKTDDLSEDLIALLIKYREKLRAEKNWQLADQIRNDLEKIGIILKDTPEGTEWRQKH